jgi:FMN-dependent NADH-azoreductase
MKTLYHLNSSGRQSGSTSRLLTKELIQKIDPKKEAKITERDISQGLHFVSEPFINAMYTPAENRSEEQKNILSLSDTLVAELAQADMIFIGVPMYNFAAPAALKAWADLVARAGVTFKYTEKGPEGLLKGKKVYVVVSSGGVKIASPQDFLTPWLKFFLGFLGMDDVTFIAAEGTSINAEEALNKARGQIERIAA